MFKKFILFSIFITFSFFLNGCGGIKKVDTDVPISGEDRARKNIREGRAASLGNLLGQGRTNYEFSTSNPLWRASLEILDFIPLSTVDYSGGIIITDWYNDSSSNDAIKITVRFLSNEVRPENLKIIIHKKNCAINENCQITEVGSVIKQELLTSIIKKAAQFELDQKNKEKK